MPQGTVLKAEEAARSWSECDEKQGQHLTPPESLRASDGPAVGTQMGGGRAAKGRCSFTSRRGMGHDPKSMRRPSCGEGLLQNFVQNKGKASLDTGASPSAWPDFSIRGEKKVRGDKTWGEAGQGASPSLRSPPSPQPRDCKDDPCKAGCGTAEAPLARAKPAAPGGFTSAGLGLSWSPWRRSVHV